MSGALVHTRYFDAVSLADADAALMDGGMHGVQGHTLYVGPGATARWERRLDSFRPVGRAGQGTLALTAEERAWLDGGLAGARQLALAGRTQFFPAGPPKPMRWVWAVVLRHEGRLLLLEGGGMSPDAAPPELAPLLAWLVERVDREAERPG